MTLKLAINGFGRIGRKVFREALKQEKIEIVANRQSFRSLVSLELLGAPRLPRGKVLHACVIDRSRF